MVPSSKLLLCKPVNWTVVIEPRTKSHRCGSTSRLSRMTILISTWAGFNNPRPSELLPDNTIGHRLQFLTLYGRVSTDFYEFLTITSKAAPNLVGLFIHRLRFPRDSSTINKWTHSFTKSISANIPHLACIFLPISTFWEVELKGGGWDVSC